MELAELYDAQSVVIPLVFYGFDHYCGVRQGSDYEYAFL